MFCSPCRSVMRDLSSPGSSSSPMAEYPSIKLTGPALLARLDELRDVSTAAQAMGCGYVIAKGRGSGGYKPNFAAFYRACAEAHGQVFPPKATGKGPVPTYRGKCRTGGFCNIGPTYCKQIGIAAGDQFRIIVDGARIVITKDAGATAAGDGA